LVVKNAVFLGGSSLSAQTYRSLADVQKFITPKLFIISRSLNNYEKAEKVLHDFSIRLSIRFLLHQHQIHIF
jgi:hypothetical protein